VVGEAGRRHVGDGRAAVRGHAARQCLTAGTGSGVEGSRRSGRAVAWPLPCANADDVGVGRSLGTRVILLPPWHGGNTSGKEVGKLLVSNGLLYRESSVHTSQLRCAGVAICLFRLRLVDFYYMKIIARPNYLRGLGFSSCHLLKRTSRIKWRLFGWGGKSGPGTRHGAAGRGRPPQAAARRSALKW
jgi:hypothetical protein